MFTDLKCFEKWKIICLQNEEDTVLFMDSTTKNHFKWMDWVQIEKWIFIRFQNVTEEEKMRIGKGFEFYIIAQRFVSDRDARIENRT